jgi:hypothetical protein
MRNNVIEHFYAQMREVNRKMLLRMFKTQEVSVDKLHNFGLLPKTTLTKDGIQVDEGGIIIELGTDYHPSA